MRRANISPVQIPLQWGFHPHQGRFSFQQQVALRSTSLFATNGDNRHCYLQILSLFSTIFIITWWCQITVGLSLLLMMTHCYMESIVDWTPSVNASSIIHCGLDKYCLINIIGNLTYWHIYNIAHCSKLSFSRCCSNPFQEKLTWAGFAPYLLPTSPSLPFPLYSVKSKRKLRSLSPHQSSLITINHHKSASITN